MWPVGAVGFLAAWLNTLAQRSCRTAHQHCRRVGPLAQSRQDFKAWVFNEQLDMLSARALLASRAVDAAGMGVKLLSQAAASPRPWPSAAITRKR
jgi:hypothetical protein